MKINEEISEKFLITCGLPQGSVSIRDLHKRHTTGPRKEQKLFSIIEKKH